MAFDIDDIAIGPDFIILAKGQRRVRVDGLSSADLNELRLRWHKFATLSPHLRDQFEAAGFATSPNKHARIVRAYLPSRYVTAIGSRLTFLTSPISLIIMVTFSLGTFICWFHHIFSGSLNMRVFTNLSARNIITIACLFCTSLFIHELGHASSCLRVSGAVGGIRAGWSKGLLLMATDVTSAGSSSKFDQVTVAAAGPAWHFSLITPIFLLNQIEMLSLNVALFISIAIFLASLFSVLPGIYNDGYYIILESTGIDISKVDSKLKSNILKFSKIIKYIFIAQTIFILSYICITKVT